MRASRGISCITVIWLASSIFGVVFSARAGSENALSQTGTLDLGTWHARILPGRLAILAKIDGIEREILIASSGEENHPVSSFRKGKGSLSWTIADLGLDAEVSAQKNRLRVRWRASRELRFAWPVSGRAPEMSALILPDGEGLYIPFVDPFWRRRFRPDDCRDTHGGLSMPFWSYQLQGKTVTYLVVSDLQTELCFSEERGRLYTRAVHAFRGRDEWAPYEIIIWVGEGSPISPAIEYREWLIENGLYVSLDEKIRANPEVSKLLGATHVYVWGDGRRLEFLREIQGLGIDRLWLGYDQDPRKPCLLVNAEYISEARRIGFLIGPYDSFSNIQEPASADAPNAVWDSELYPAGCIVSRDGSLLKGFGGRGCELSSEALERAEDTKHYISRRVDSHRRSGINSYFLDVDASGELFDDYSTQHPMTPYEDRLNRLKRMRFISEGEKLVLGSESAAGWSAPVLHFSHGAHSVQNEVIWPFMKDKRRFGGWWPPERPAIFFKPVHVDADFQKAKYDPVYRLPLYQAVFHGSVVATDRWELSYLKFPELVQTRALIELLYNVPSIWSLDLRELKEHGKRLAAYYRFFSSVHRRAGSKPLNSFRWLTSDKTVQETIFGDDLTMTANFRGTRYGMLPPLCIQAKWRKDRREELFCPEP